MTTDYLKYRGKCKQYSEKLVAEDQSLRLVRGNYYCPVWGSQQHWWCEKADGTVVDPTALQFPSKGCGTYEEFDGICQCEMCGKSFQEDDGYFAGRHCYCSGDCYEKDVSPTYLK